MYAWVCLYVFVPICIGVCVYLYVCACHYRECGRTAEREVSEVYRDVVLPVCQLAGLAFQVVTVTGVLCHPLHLVATVSLGCHPGIAALETHTHRES